jgi:hypothetical protein
VLEALLEIELTIDAASLNTNNFRIHRRTNGEHNTHI